MSRKMYEVLSNKKPNSNEFYPFQIGDIIEIQSMGKRSNGTQAIEMYPEDYTLKVNGQTVINAEITPSVLDCQPELFKKIDHLLINDSVIPFHSMDGRRVCSNLEQWWYQYVYENKEYVSHKEETWKCVEQKANGWVIRNSEGHEVFICDWLLEKR